MANNSAQDNPDKEYLYGEFQRTQRWRDRLSKKLAHKSLDIPDEDEMNVVTTNMGLGWKELAVLAASIIGAAYVIKGQGEPEKESTPVTIESPADSEYEVRFYDAQGKPIVIPPYPHAHNE